MPGDGQSVSVAGEMSGPSKEAIAIMTRVLHRQTGHSYPVAAGGQGITIRDAAGKDYIDASSGAAVSCVGHSHPDVLAAMREQLDRLAYAHTSFFTTEVAEALADDLVAHAPHGVGHVFFVSGGSEAIEAALKLARQYFVERGEPQRRYIIARRQSYHGITLGALAIGGREWQRKQFAPLLIETHHVSPVYEYRDRRAGESPQAYGERLAQELESKIKELGGENVIAFVAETVVGATLGAFQHSHTYMGHPLACAAALAVQRVMRRDNLLANVRSQGAHLARRLKERFGNHPFVGDVRGRGLFQGIELVADRRSKEPFDSKLKLHARVKREAMARGLLVYPMGGSADGVRGDHILLAPPFIIDAVAIDTVVERLGEAIDTATVQIQ